MNATKRTYFENISLLYYTNIKYIPSSWNSITKRSLKLKQFQELTINNLGWRMLFLTQVSFNDVWSLRKPKLNCFTFLSGFIFIPALNMGVTEVAGKIIRNIIDVNIFELCSSWEPLCSGVIGGD